MGRPRAVSAQAGESTGASAHVGKGYSPTGCTQHSHSPRGRIFHRHSLRGHTWGRRSSGGHDDAGVQAEPAESSAHVGIMVGQTVWQRETTILRAKFGCEVGRSSGVRVRAPFRALFSAPAGDDWQSLFA